MNLFAATFCPLKNDFTLNTGIVGEYGTFLKSSGLKGVFVNGSTGNFVSLSTDERMELIEAWATDKPTDFQIINHVGHLNLFEAKKLTTHSKDLVNGIAAIYPFYFLPRNINKVIEYCSQIAECAPHLPFYYYHIPVLTNINIDILEFTKAARKEIPNFKGIKFTDNNLDEYESLQKHFDSLEFMYGVDEQFAQSYMRGANGWVGSTYNFLSPIFYQIKEAIDNDNINHAMTLQHKVIEVINMLNELSGYHGAAKSFLKILGLDLGPSRFPHENLSDIKLEIANQRFQRIGLNLQSGNFLSKLISIHNIKINSQ